MSLYLGNSAKVKVNLNNVICHFKLFSGSLIINSIKLSSSDNYILKDSNGLFLTVKDGE